MTRYMRHAWHNLHKIYALYSLFKPLEIRTPYHRKRVPGRHFIVLYSPYKKGPWKTLYRALLPIEKESLEDTVLWYIGIPSKWKNRVTQCDKKNNSIVSVKIVSYICVILQK